jgi:hypothetical protein
LTGSLFFLRVGEAVINVGCNKPVEKDFGDQWRGCFERVRCKFHESAVPYLVFEGVVQGLDEGFIVFLIGLSVIKLFLDCLAGLRIIILAIEKPWPFLWWTTSEEFSLEDISDVACSPRFW